MRVLFIDDDEGFSALISQYLRAEGIDAACEADPNAGLARALGGDFDAIVLDVMMPELDGVELLRRLRRESDVPVLMLTARGDSLDRTMGLECGADDYLPKPCYPRELVARLRAVVRRTQAAPRRPRAADRLSVGPLHISPRRREAELGGSPLDLTASEFEILAALAEAPGQVVTKDELSRQALGRPHETYDRSVDVHVSNLRQKLTKSGDGGVEVETVRGIGYRLRLSG